MRAKVCAVGLVGLAALCSCGGSDSSGPGSFPVQVTVSGLVPGNQLVLLINASEFTITANGTFSLEAAGPNPASTVIATQPNNETCGAGGDGAPGSNALILTVGCIRNGQFIYVVNAAGNTLSMYSVGADGALIPLNPATAVTGQHPQSISVDPSGLFAYVANESDNSIFEFDIGSNGVLSADSQGLIQQQPNLAPRAISIEPGGTYAYVLDSGNDSIVQTSIGPNGHLQLGAAVPTGSLPWAVVTVFENGYAYVTNHDDNTVSEYALGSGGMLTPLNPATVATGQAPSGIAVSPADGGVYVANISDNTISQFSIGAGGGLTPMVPATVSAGSQPAYMQIDAMEKNAYVVNFNGGNAGSISQFAISKSGDLSPIGSAVPTGKGPTMLVLDGTGQFAYVTNSMDNTVSQYAVAADGALTPLATPTVSTGEQPVAIAVTF